MLPGSTRETTRLFGSTLKALLVFVVAFVAFEDVALACACCDGGSNRRPIAWSARGAALVDYRGFTGCEETHGLEIWRAGATRPVACFDLYGDDPNARMDCRSLNSADEQDEQLRQMSPADRLRRTSRTRFFPLPVKRLHPNHVRAKLRPARSTPDASGPEAILVVAIQGADGTFHEVLRRRVTYHSSDDPSGESPQGRNPISVAVFPSPDSSRALVRFSGHDIDPGIGNFPDELRSVELPPLTEGALVDSAPNIVALLPARPSQDGGMGPARAWLNRRGLRAHAQGDFHQSARLFANAVMHDPSAAMPRFNLACASARLGATDQALWLLEELGSRASECEPCREALQRARTDEDLASVRSDPRFVSAVAHAADSPPAAARSGQD